MEKVCLVIGAGAGIGGTVAKKFASDGYHAYLARRTDEEGLNRLIKEIEDAGGKASGSLLNVIEENSIEDLVNKIESETGPIDTVIYNIGAQLGIELWPIQVIKLLKWAGAWQLLVCSGSPKYSLQR